MEALGPPVVPKKALLPTRATKDNQGEGPGAGRPAPRPRVVAAVRVTVAGSKAALVERLATVEVHLPFIPYRRRPRVGRPTATDAEIMAAGFLRRAPVTGGGSFPPVGEAGAVARVALLPRDRCRGAAAIAQVPIGVGTKALKGGSGPSGEGIGGDGATSPSVSSLVTASATGAPEVAGVGGGRRTRPGPRPFRGGRHPVIRSRDGGPRPAGSSHGRYDGAIGTRQAAALGKERKVGRTLSGRPIYRAPGSATRGLLSMARGSSPIRRAARGMAHATVGCPISLVGSGCGADRAGLSRAGGSATASSAVSSRADSRRAAGVVVSVGGTEAAIPTETPKGRDGGRRGSRVPTTYP